MTDTPGWLGEGRGRTVPGVGPGAVPRGRAGAGRGHRTPGLHTGAGHGGRTPALSMDYPGAASRPPGASDSLRHAGHAHARGHTPAAEPPGGGRRGARTALRTHLPCRRRGAATDRLKDGTDGTDGTDEPEDRTDGPTDGTDAPNARPPPPGDASPLPRQRRWGGAA